MGAPESWTLLGTGPTRDYQGFVFDSKADRFFLFGGQVANNVPTNDTWSYDYDTNAWTNVTKGAAPSARAGFGMAYDSQADRIVLFGGTNSTLLNDTWVFDPTTYTWTQRLPTASPPRLFSPMMVFDAHADRTIVTGLRLGSSFLDTWAYDYVANRWLPVSASGPSSRSGAAMAYDSAAQRELLFGGISNSGSPLNDTWSFDYTSRSWTNRSPSSTPPGRNGMVLAYDAAVDRLVLFGGTSIVASTQVIYHDTWAYDDTANAWSNLTVFGAPSGRYLGAMDYDSVAHVEVMCGGTENGLVFLDEAWSFQLAAVVPPTLPLALVAAAGVVRINLTWTAPYWNGGASVTNYSVYRGTASGAEAYLAAAGPTTAYTDRAVTAGTVYYYEVAAVNSAGEGPKSAEAYATPLADTSPPTVAIASPANNSLVTSAGITVSGTASDDVGVAKVEVSVGGSTWTQATGTNSWSANVTLQPGTNTVYARATDTSGNVRTAMITVTLQSTASPFALSPVVLAALVIVVAVAILAAILMLRRRKRKPEPPPPPS